MRMVAVSWRDSSRDPDWNSVDAHLAHHDRHGLVHQAIGFVLREDEDALILIQGLKEPIDHTALAMAMGVLAIPRESITEQSELSTLPSQKGSPERHGRTAKGSRNGAAALTEDQVRAIRNLYRAGELQHVIAQAFHVHQTTVSRVVRGKWWAHVTD